MTGGHPERSGDWSLYLVTDSLFLGDRPLAEVVREAVAGGATVVQYREKRASTRRMVVEAQELVAICRPRNVPFLINDRLDVALAVGADGVHLGQDDMPLPLARKILGPEKILGITVHNESELEAAEAQGADYLSLAPVFATSTKPDHQPPMGLQGLRKLAAKAHLPTVAIGGITRENAADVVRCGVDGICVVSAILAASDPRKAAGELVERVQTARVSMRAGRGAGFPA